MESDLKMSETFISPPATLSLKDADTGVPFPFRSNPLTEENGSPHTPTRTHAAAIPFPFRSNPLTEENGSPHTPTRAHTAAIPYSASRTHPADTPPFSGSRRLRREGAVIFGDLTPLPSYSEAPNSKYYKGMFSLPTVSPIELLMTRRSQS